MKEDLIDKIKSNGYVRVNFQPLAYGEKFKLAECKNIIESNAVQFRGWDYPHVSRRNDDNGGFEPAGKYYQGWVDWESYLEFWRMYKTGQFLHYRALTEDWLARDSWFAEYAEKIKPGTSLAVISSVTFLLTEIFAFLSQMAKDGIYGEGVKIEVSYHNMGGRSLWVDDKIRIPFSFPRKTAAPEIKFSKTLTQDEAINDSKELALEAILEVFDNFDWENPPLDTIKQDQEKLLTRRL